MGSLPRFATLFSVITFFAPLTFLNAASAQSTDRQVGTQLTVTADPRVPRPAVTPCTVTLFQGLQFAYFSTSVQNFSFAPPARCAGPWQKVVLEVNFGENAGRQFDRTASIYLANTNIYFGTTPEPIKTADNHWHIERDVTDYAALLRSAQPGAMVLQNCTTDCPPPYNTELTGVFTVSADIEFYPANGARNTPRTPDTVLPLVQPNATGVNLPATLSSPTDQLTTTFSLPRNIEEAYLDVVSQSQSTDEQWFACFPNDLASINEIYGCGNTGFRETEVMVDGNRAGIAPISPWVYTGFLPDQWQPIPGVQTLDFVPYRVNLTPFAALLSDGRPHTIALSVFNDDSYFSVTSSLLLYLDRGRQQITGALTKNTLTAPSPVVSEKLKGTSTVTGKIGVTSNRNFTIAGYVNTSHGRVATSVIGQQRFSNTQTIDFDVAAGSVLDQKTNMDSGVLAVTSTSSPSGQTWRLNDFHFPITVDFVYPVSTSPFGFTVTTTQKYQDRSYTLQGNRLLDFDSVIDQITSSDVSPAHSTQHYSSFDLQTGAYDCTVDSKENVLTSVSRGCRR